MLEVLETLLCTCVDRRSGVLQRLVNSWERVAVLGARSLMVFEGVEAREEGENGLLL